MMDARANILHTAIEKRVDQCVLDRALELWSGRVTGLVAGERKPAKVLALRRRKGA